MRLLLLDNYDSFTFNLAQYLQELGAELEVSLSDRLTVEQAGDGGFDAVVISPGPGRPEEAGISLELIRRYGDRLPILGVCLGHQSIAQAFGAAIVQAPTLMHGKTSEIHHHNQGVFAGLPQPFEATRYHSLTIDPPSLDPAFEITARTADDVIMGIRHREHPLHGVQFHPESILTRPGKQLLGNFLEIVARRGAAQASATES